MPMTIANEAVRTKKGDMLMNPRTFDEIVESRNLVQKCEYSCGRQGCKLRADDVIETDDGIACVHCIK